jgi:hypothetical protein
VVSPNKSNHQRQLIDLRPIRYTDRIQPWLHYVPVQFDLSDLYDILVYFRGLPESFVTSSSSSGASNASRVEAGFEARRGDDHLARSIASAGSLWAKDYWRKEDIGAYMYRTFLEYARLMSEDRDAMTMTDEEGQADV